jgi:hypothetical protein
LTDPLDVPLVVLDYVAEVRQAAETRLFDRVAGVVAPDRTMWRIVWGWM